MSVPTNKEITEWLREAGEYAKEYVRQGGGGVRDQNAAAKLWFKRTVQVEAGGWQPIETAPKNGTEVLVCRAYEDETVYAVAHYEGHEWRDMGDIGWGGMTGDDNQPTHWQPLPEPPEGR